MQLEHPSPEATEICQGQEEDLNDDSIHPNSDIDASEQGAGASSDKPSDEIRRRDANYDAKEDETSEEKEEEGGSEFAESESESELKSDGSSECYLKKRKREKEEDKDEGDGGNKAKERPAEYVSVLSLHPPAPGIERILHIQVNSVNNDGYVLINSKSVQTKLAPLLGFSDLKTRKTLR